MNGECVGDGVTGLESEADVLEQTPIVFPDERQQVLGEDSQLRPVNRPHLQGLIHKPLVGGGVVERDMFMFFAPLVQRGPDAWLETSRDLRGRVGSDECVAVGHLDLH